MSILREITQERHQAVENLPFVQYLLRGGITSEHYVIYLAEMAEIYNCLESAADQAGLMDGLDGLHRAARIRTDLEELSPGHVTVLTASTQRYLQHIKQLAESDHARDLFAHVYVRHLGDMYGGKLIARAVPGTGRWYEFDNRADLVKAFNSKLSLDLANEAIVAFDYFGNIFQDIWHQINIVNE
jgi:heme oxygenase